MPRKPLIRSRIHPYHVSARCNNKEAFYSPLPAVWNIFNHEINEMVSRYSWKIHSFVLMPNHFHLLVSTPNEDLGVIMQTFLISITKKINKHSQRSGRVFGSRYHWSLVDNDQYLDCVMKYIYRNPVKAGLTEKAESYPFSTLRWITEQNFRIYSLSPIFGHQHIIPNNNLKHFLDWTNKSFHCEQEAAIKAAFKKTVFSPPKLGNMQKQIKLDHFRSMNMTR